MSKFLLPSLALCFVVPFALEACGGASDVTIGEDGTATDSGATPTATTTTTAPPTSPTNGNDASPPPGNDAGDAATAPDGAICPTYYLDGDNDGFGGTTKQVTCTPPTSSPAGGTWVTVGGDCNDANKSVFPGQTSYFGAGYSSGVGTAATSFDYDCSTKEDAAPALAKAGTCTPGGDGCIGAGYLPAEPARPTGTGVDPYCGSVRFRTCRFVNGQCIPADGASLKSYDCR